MLSFMCFPCILPQFDHDAMKDSDLFVTLV